MLRESGCPTSPLFCPLRRNVVELCSKATKIPKIRVLQKERLFITVIFYVELCRGDYMPFLLSFHHCFVSLGLALLEICFGMIKGFCSILEMELVNLTQSSTVL
jgi:hypothetical protein